MKASVGKQMALGGCQRSWVANVRGAAGVCDQEMLVRPQAQVYHNYADRCGASFDGRGSV